MSHFKTFEDAGSDINDYINKINLTGDYDLNGNLDDVAGYDLIYLDYNVGTDDIRRNAALFQQVIRWVNQQKAANGSAQLNVVIGESMGGLVTRYALADMARQNQATGTRLLITHDSPHRGANVPLGFQALARDVSNTKIMGIPLSDIVPPLRDVNNLLNTPAVRQMLIVQDGTTNTFLEGEYRTMVNRNIPGCQLVAISNGSECGIGQGFNPHAELFKVKANAYVNGFMALAFSPVIAAVLGVRYFNNESGTIAGRLIRSGGVALIAQIGIVALTPFYNKNWKVDVVVNALPNQQSQRVFYGKLTSEKKILYVIPVNVTMWERSRNSTTAMLPWDNSPGGFYALDDMAAKLPGNPNINLYPIVSANLNINLVNQFNFVPTVSALDISNINAAALTAVYTGESSPGNASRLGNFITQERVIGTSEYNSQHTVFTARNSQWAYNKMEGIAQPSASCSAFCNNTNLSITGPGSICGTGYNYSVAAIPGVNYRWTTSTNIRVNSGQGTNRINISTTGTNIAKGWIRVTAESGPGCGNLDFIQRNVSLNGATFTWNDNRPDGFCPPDMITANLNVTGGASNFIWTATGDLRIASAYNKSADIIVPSGANGGTVSVSFLNSCGQTQQTTEYYTRSSGCSGYTYSVYPNPANDYIEIAPEGNLEDNPAFENDYEVKLFDFIGEEKISLRTKRKAEKLRLNTKKLKKGTYILHIITNEETIKKQIIIEK